MQTVADYNFTDRKALVRVDFNVPLNDNFEITDSTRIRAALPTLRKILKDKGSIILMSHLGRPKDKENKYSLKHLVPALNEYLNTEVAFSPDCIGEETESLASQLKPGKVLLLENLRYHPEETSGDHEFAQKLARLGDVYVNDAFGTAHRAHTSTAVIAEYFDQKNRMFGYLMAKEISFGKRLLEKTEQPFTVIIGGAKVSDKIPLIGNLLDRAFSILIGGGMAYTFIKAQGGHIGDSLVELDKLDMASDLLDKAYKKRASIFLPVDSVCADSFSANANTRIEHSTKIAPGWMGLDIGPASRRVFEKQIHNSLTILWNGPMGVFEMKPFSAGTFHIARSIANETKSGAFSLVGGGDSVAAVNQAGVADSISYVSTGGGALLEMLEGKQLPGVQAIMK